jgi:hypothetical protein
MFFTVMTLSLWFLPCEAMLELGSGSNPTTQDTNAPQPRTQVIYESIGYMKAGSMIYILRTINQIH